MSDFEIGSGLFFDHFARIELARWMHIPPGLSSTQRLPSWVKRIISSSAEEAEEAAREGDGRSEDGSSEDEETVDSLLWLAQVSRAHLARIASRSYRLLSPRWISSPTAPSPRSSSSKRQPRRPPRRPARHCRGFSLPAFFHDLLADEALRTSLFAKGLRQHSFTRASTSPVSPPLVAQNRRRTMSIGSVPVNDSEVEMDALLAAEWCIKGLAIELTKKVPGAKNGRRKSATSMHKRTGGVSDSPSEDESHEGKRFGLERALDLVVGVSVRVSTSRIETDIATAHGLVSIWYPPTGSIQSDRGRSRSRCAAIRTRSSHCQKNPLSSRRRSPASDPLQLDIFRLRCIYHFPRRCSNSPPDRLRLSTTSRSHAQSYRLATSCTRRSIIRASLHFHSRPLLRSAPLSRREIASDDSSSLLLSPRSLRLHHRQEGSRVLLEGDHECIERSSRDERGRRDR